MNKELPNNTTLEVHEWTEEEKEMFLPTEISTKDVDKTEEPIPLVLRIEPYRELGLEDISISKGTRDRLDREFAKNKSNPFKNKHLNHKRKYRR